MDKKLWNRADVRAEMNRMVKEATDACKKLHDVAGRIAALGVETNFGDDALTALEALRKRAAIARVGFTPTPVRTADGRPVHSVGEVSKDIPCKMRKPTKYGGFILTPGTRLPGMWRDYGCTCGMSTFNVSGLCVWHAEGCPVRVPGEK